MPNWGEHLLIANKLLKRIKFDENLFLFRKYITRCSGWIFGKRHIKYTTTQDKSL